MVVLHDYLRGTVQASRVARKVVDNPTAHLAMPDRPRH